MRCRRRIREKLTTPPRASAEASTRRGSLLDRKHSRLKMTSTFSSAAEQISECTSIDVGGPSTSRWPLTLGRLRLWRQSSGNLRGIGSGSSQDATPEAASIPTRGDVAGPPQDASAEPRNGHRRQRIREEKLLRYFASQHDFHIDLDSFPPDDISFLLMRRSSHFVIKTLARSQKALNELTEMEKTVDPTRLDALFKSGNALVLGQDVGGRPVLWLRSIPSIHVVQKPYTEFILFTFWVLFWCMRKRPDEKTGIFVVYDESDRKLLDFNLGFANQAMTLLRRFLPRKHPDAVVWLFTKGKLASTVSSATLRALEFASSHEIKPRTAKAQTLRMLRDPTMYPSWFLPGGKEFSPSFDTVGNYLDIVDRRCGFRNLTLRDLFRPSPALVEIAGAKSSRESSLVPSSPRSERSKSFKGKRLIPFADIQKTSKLSSPRPTKSRERTTLSTILEDVEEPPG